LYCFIFFMKIKSVMSSSKTVSNKITIVQRFVSFYTITLFLSQIENDIKYFTSRFRKNND